MALSALHAASVNRHVTPHNALLNVALNLHIADFAASAVDMLVLTVVTGPKYEPPDWNWRRLARNVGRCLTT